MEYIHLGEFLYWCVEYAHFGKYLYWCMEHPYQCLGECLYWCMQCELWCKQAIQRLCTNSGDVQLQLVLDVQRWS